ncbi:MAG TPA: GNAT family N-acetyltransferase [bacterium]
MVQRISGAKTMKIQAVATRLDLKRFIDFPYHLHRHLPNWIPPLKFDQKNVFNPKKNSVLTHCDYQIFLLYDNEKIIGRIAVYVNHVANDYWKEKIGFFGHYECIDDQNAASQLLGTAEQWLRERGMEKMRGQWNFVSQDIGFISEGFDIPPIVLSPYNPPYYNDHVAAFGMQKAKDLLVYSCDISKGYKIPDRFLEFTDRIAERYRVTVRPINMKKLVEDARIIVRLTNESIAGNWGYYPVDESEAEQIAADLKMIVHPEVVLIAEIDSEPIGYIITLPDVNYILKDLNGRLFPFGIFKLLSGIKKLRRYRIWALGILPLYQKKGISVLLFRRLNDILGDKGVYVEANWVLEDNALMNNALVQLQFDLVKKYRIYEKQIGRIGY